KSRYGRAYWHREHQLPGVSACPEHCIPLICSGIACDSRATQYISLDRYLETNPKSSPIQSVVPMKFRIKIAKSFTWLLRNKPQSTDMKWIRERYFFELAEKAFASYTQRVHLQELSKRIVDFFSPEVLKELGCSLQVNARKNEFGATWLLRLLRSSPGQPTQPLHHILFCIFLGYSMEQFFLLPKQIQYFGTPPWPCLNP